MHDWLLPVPPQSAVRIDCAASQVPVQPLRWTVPKSNIAPENEPSPWSIAPPLTAPGPVFGTETKCAAQTMIDPWMH
jgi:hypothetical protein